MSKLTLKVIDNEFTIHRFSADYEIPLDQLTSKFFSITRTEDELSIVCDSTVELSSKVSESGWNALKVLGPLDFSLTGILANISKILAEASISIFALSTFDTDYILVKSEALNNAISSLKNDHYCIIYN